MIEHPHRATIPPVPEGTPRPLWSVMIPTYNCAGYLRETLASVLAQDPGPEVMQIEVVDDCSTRDDPEAVVRELGGGRVGFYRQPQNIGHVGNFNTCLRRSRGRLVHLLHGDDRVRAGFYAIIERAFEGHPQIGSAFCRHIAMNEHGDWRYVSPLEQGAAGVLPDALGMIGARQPIQPPAVVVRREVYERLGGFDGRMAACGEDWEMWVRIAAHYPVWFEPEPLAEYRKHSGSLSGRSFRTGQNLRDVRRAIGIYGAYLPPDRAGEITRQAREISALWGIGLAARMLAAGDRRAALAQVWEALRCSRSPRVMAELGLLVGRSGAFWGRRLGDLLPWRT